MNEFFAPSYKVTSNGKVSGGYPTPEIGIISDGDTASDPTSQWVGGITTGATTNIKGLAVDAGNHWLFALGVGMGIMVYQSSRVNISS